MIPASLNPAPLLPGIDVLPIERKRSNGDANKLGVEDRAAHDWYRFVLSFPPHLVRDYLRRLEIKPGQCVLDPFCGTGTTLVECKKQGIGAIGIEANPMAWFASRTKLDWSPDPESLRGHARQIADAALADFDLNGIDDLPLLKALIPRLPDDPLRRLPDELDSLLLTASISPLPLHKSLVLWERLATWQDPRFTDHEKLAFAKALVYSISNLHFGPEVGVRPPKKDAPVVKSWLDGVDGMAADLESLQPSRSRAEWIVHHGDARQAPELLEPGSIDVVITSPPYPNEKDYTRTTRLESVLMGFIRSKAELQRLKRSLVRSNTRGTYRADDDDRWVAHHLEIQRIASEIETRRIEMNKTSGFERAYARVTRLYFGGMARHLAELRSVLKPGARLAYVVGDQASYLRVMIRTGELLADIAQSLGYELISIDLFRTRLASATKEQLREEVVLLRWPREGPRN